ncbi:unnamed protein product [Cyclocybe aegerita]|uniref:F-box domain-containing protein n=1 Tax=Cyclocybe aegerita TaxID=1973307 RepID=A0A8S0VTW0_CYCAE|nr:unnamed protein product [Cyclocybe aegerita]
MAIVAPLRAPIRALPPELLRVIFEMTLPESDRSLKSSTPPLLLCQVCKIWRDVAITSPTLWNSVSVDASSVRTIANCVHLLEMAVERAGDTPIGLDLHEYMNYSKQGAPPLLLTTLAPSFSRYQNLSLSVQSPHWYHDLALMSPALSSLPKLKNLTLLVNHHNIEFNRGLNISPLHLFKAAPLLTSVCLDLKHPGGNLFIHLPYSQLLDLDYRLTLRVPNSTSYAIRCWQAAIACATNLISAKLTFLSQRNVFRQQPTLKPAENPKPRTSDVQELAITYGVLGDVGSIFYGLELPKLSTLSFRAVRACLVIVDRDAKPSMLYYFDVKPLRPTLFHKLESLTLLFVLIYDNQLLSLLEAIPNIRHFCLLSVAECSICRLPQSFGPKKSALTRFLTVPVVEEEAVERADYLLPKLETLELFYPATTIPCTSSS